MLIIVIMTFVTSCEAADEKRKGLASKNHTTAPTTQGVSKKPASNIPLANEDSLRTEKALSDALVIAQNNIGKPKFHSKLSADTNYNINVDISIDNYFTSSGRHLIVRTYEPGSIKIDIFFITNDTFTKVVSYQQGMLVYMNDTMRDVNGDGLKDFVANWYGSSGCCLKGFADVYLMRPDRKTVSSELQFINPTFSPNEHLVRGVCYGYPGRPELYKFKFKFKFNGDSVDTVEYISYERNKKGKKAGKVLVSKYRSHHDSFKVLKCLNTVQAEYLTIEGYDWFSESY